MQMTSINVRHKRARKAIKVVRTMAIQRDGTPKMQRGHCMSSSSKVITFQQNLETAKTREEVTCRIGTCHIGLISKPLPSIQDRIDTRWSSMINMTLHSSAVNSDLLLLFCVSSFRSADHNYALVVLSETNLLIHWFSGSCIWHLCRHWILIAYPWGRTIVYDRTWRQTRRLDIQQQFHQNQNNQDRPGSSSLCAVW
jgi:hypothetical protein